MLFDKENDVICDFVNQDNGIIEITFEVTPKGTSVIKKRIQANMLEHGLVNGYDYTINGKCSTDIHRMTVQVNFVHQQDFTIMKLMYG